MFGVLFLTLNLSFTVRTVNWPTIMLYSAHLAVLVSSAKAESVLEDAEEGIKVSDARLEKINKVEKWFKTNSIVCVEYLRQKIAACALLCE